MRKLIAAVAFATAIWTIACASGVAEKEADKKPESGSAETSSASGNQGRGTASLDLDGGKVSIDYGRPTLRGRDILSFLSAGEEWRMGADSATKLTSDLSLKFGDKVVPKGEYVLAAYRVEEEKWNLLIKTEDGSTIAQAPMTFQRVADSAEQMTIMLEKAEGGGKFMLHWGTFTLTANFQKA
ncbi:MAG: DUF2911 domain-containing protein [Blastocatellia bacterium]|nr:DUF2911 domain-containing protein [Blastocatellia bacterium]